MDWYLYLFFYSSSMPGTQLADQSFHARLPVYVHAKTNKKNPLGYFAKVGEQMFFKVRISKIRKFFGSIRNRKSQIRKFMMYASPQISNLHISFD
jgi:hypothetical protein